MDRKPKSNGPNLDMCNPLGATVPTKNYIYGVESTAENGAALYAAHQQGMSAGYRFCSDERAYDQKERLALIQRRQAGGMSFHDAVLSLYPSSPSSR